MYIKIYNSFFFEIIEKIYNKYINKWKKDIDQHYKNNYLINLF